MKQETKHIHAGIHPDPNSGAVMTPIYQTSTYSQEAPGKHKGYEYGRTHNPTREVLENNMAALENGVEAFCFSSGLAAQDALMKTLKSGDEIVSTNDLYGGSYRQIENVFGQFGLKGRYVDMEKPALVEAAINENTKMMWIETPTNPLLKVIDIKKMVSIAKTHGLKVVVDNTFASPYLQRPLDLGADFVLHSATKYLGGHSDTVHGVIVCKHSDDAEKIRFLQNSCGAVPGPMDCFLVLRGIKTLHVRMDRACKNAAAIAAFLNTRPEVGRVIYPGDPKHSGHETAKKQMSDFGAMVSFDLKSGSIDDAYKVMSNTKLFTLAESLGGVESLIGHPSSMTHAAIPREDRIASGLTDTLIRLSIGIEHVDDLISDLTGALDQL